MRLLAVALAALVLLPFAGSAYLVHVAIVVLMNVVYTASLYAIMRMGYLSLGHAGFITLGAYGCVILTVKFGLSPWLRSSRRFVQCGLLPRSPKTNRPRKFVSNEHSSMQSFAVKGSRSPTSTRTASWTSLRASFGMKHRNGRCIS